MARPKLEGYVATQTRIPKEMHEYMEQESKRMHMSTNAVLVMLLENGKTLWEATKTNPTKFLE